MIPFRVLEGWDFTLMSLKRDQRPNAFPSATSGARGRCAQAPRGWRVRGGVPGPGLPRAPSASGAAPGLGRAEAAAPSWWVRPGRSSDGAPLRHRAWVKAKRRGGWDPSLAGSVRVGLCVGLCVRPPGGVVFVRGGPGGAAGPSAASLGIQWLCPP